MWWADIDANTTTQMRCAVKPLQPLQWLHFYEAIARVLQSHRNGFSVALHCHCGNRSERKHWNFNGCAAIALPFFLAWNYCDGFAKPLLGIMQPLQWFWEAIAMVLRSHCNGLAEKADRCLFCCSTIAEWTMLYRCTELLFTTLQCSLHAIVRKTKKNLMI